MQPDNADEWPDVSADDDYIETSANFNGLRPQPSRERGPLEFAQLFIIQTCQIVCSSGTPKT
jgi:hypothetical protein